MNKLKLESQIYSFENDDYRYFVPLILVDGKPLADFSYYGISLTELEQSLVKNGEYFIITCWCGVPECAGIERGIKVNHEQNTIKWIITQPEKQQFTFSVDEYKTAIIQGIEEIKENLAIASQTEQKLEIVPYPLQ